MPKLVHELKAWREAEGRKRGLGRALTFEEAAEEVVVDGGPSHKSTWFAWETGKKVPSRAHMPVLCDLLDISADVFYERRARIETAQPPVLQPSMV